MNLLAFDSSTDTLSIAVQRGADAAVWHHGGPGGAQASAALIPAILRLMQQAGLSFAQLDAIAFGRGPGSFTGLRTACSVAQGLAFGAGVMVLPIDSLLAVAEDARAQYVGSAPAGTGAPARLQVMALLDARMDELYAERFEWDGAAWASSSPCHLHKPEDLAADFAALAQSEQSASTLLAGNVFDHYGQRLPAGPWPRIQALPCARAMLRLAPQLLQAGLAVPADQALPLYIRDKVAKTTQERLLEKSTAAQPAPV
jgi:tRNA threonylcarbamoyladenosine biosynthesis protein TsaB